METKLKMPKVNFPAIDWSRWNLRKFNWMTVLAVLAYLYVLIIIPLFFRKKSAYLDYHVKQGSALFIVWVLFLFSFLVPLLPWFMAIFILFCLGVGISNAVTGREKPLPLIGRVVSQEPGVV